MIVMTPSVSAAAALALVTLAVNHAEAQGLVVAAAVVDAVGHPLAQWRMDAARAVIADFARDKAFTAAMMRRSTAAFHAEAEASSATRIGLANRPRLLVWGGGLPILHDGQVVGGIGVSGASDVDDIACATAALAAAGFGWPAA